MDYGRSGIGRSLRDAENVDSLSVSRVCVGGAMERARVEGILAQWPREANSFCSDYNGHLLYIVSSLPLVLSSRLIANFRSERRRR